jgi:hypothetical protein
MSNVRVLCKGLVVEEPASPGSPDDTNSLPPKSVHHEEVGASDPIYNRRLLLDKAERQLFGHSERLQHIDTKTGIILGFTLVAMAQVLLGLVRLSPEEVTLLRSHIPLLYIVVVLFGLSLASTLWAVSFGLLALEPRAMMFLSVKRELEKPDVATKDLLANCTRGLASGMDWNEDRLETKLKQSRYAAYGVGISIVCYVAIAATIALMLLL